MLVGSSTKNLQIGKVRVAYSSRDIMDLRVVKNQHTPTFSAENVIKIVAGAEGQYGVLYALLAGSGLRIDEAAGLEVSDVLADGMTLTIRQSLWNGRLQTPKTTNAFREIDLHPSLAAMLRGHIGQRRFGLLFSTASGKRISQTNVLKRSLRPILKELQLDKAGFHSFRRYRVTHLRKNRVPEDVLRFWIGHADKTVTDVYSKVKDDVAFRLLCATNVGLGFVLPLESLVAERDVAPNCTQTVSLSTLS